MNISRGPGPADLQRLSALERRSNAEPHVTINGFVDGGHHSINCALRRAAPPDDSVQRFLDELQCMNDYAGTSYRVSIITRDGMSTLQRAHGRPFADLGVQCAFVLPQSAAAWASRAAKAPLLDDAQQVFSIFDESVPQKNLSTARCADLVVVPPGTTLTLKALRLVAVRSPTGAKRECVVAHFASAELPCAVPYDLFTGRPLR